MRAMKTPSGLLANAAPPRSRALAVFERRVRELEEAEIRRRMEAARAITEATQNPLPRTDTPL